VEIPLPLSVEFSVEKVWKFRLCVMVFSFVDLSRVLRVNWVMSWLTDILKEVPLSEIQRERLQLEVEKHEFEITRTKAERDDFKSKLEIATAKADTLQKQLEAEQKKHELTRKELDEARAKIQEFTNQPKNPPIVTVRFPGRPMSSL